MNGSMFNYSLFNWNVRGLGDNDKCAKVRDTLMSARPHIACLQERKLANITTAKARAFLPSNLSNFHYVEASGTRGGLVTAWDDRSLSLHSFITR